MESCHSAQLGLILLRGKALLGSLDSVDQEDLCDQMWDCHMPAGSQL